MKKMVITGGQGDIARAIETLLRDEYEILSPGRSELDVTDPARVEEYFKDKVVDVLINNAGFVNEACIADTDLEKDKRAIDVNLFGTFACTHEVLKKNKDAIIIIVGSAAATRAHHDWGSYCASKAGVTMAAKCWAEDGYRVVCLAPGRTATKMRRAVYPDEDQSTLMQPEDFAVIVKQAIDGRFESGENVPVNRDNIKELLKGE